ncbi:hypothetical protein DLM75_10225 [Leptospira stimsonii]|uniref:Uncharacterized protein n=1 Tax=Leptospira stimsonii TaxID=2202203 RepID=A0A396Z9A2_9LEPT|nr:hypothetical protein DLM75_10225 [Leptospira stimsonii]
MIEAVFLSNSFSILFLKYHSRSNLKTFKNNNETIDQTGPNQKINPKKFPNGSEQNTNQKNIVSNSLKNWNGFFQNGDRLRFRKRASFSENRSFFSQF